ncbi:methylmalonyl-CoA epimerase [Anaerolineales bacterium]
MSIHKINHLAIVVEDLESALIFWRDALGLKFEGQTDVEAEAVRVGFLDANGVHIELVQPTTSDSGIAKYLEKKGQGMHHLCFDVDDVEAEMESLSAKGVEFINEAPRVRDNGTKYAFIHPRSTGGVLIELYQKP